MMSAMQLKGSSLINSRNHSRYRDMEINFRLHLGSVWSSGRLIAIPYYHQLHWVRSIAEHDNMTFGKYSKGK